MLKKTANENVIRRHEKNSLESTSNSTLFSRYMILEFEFIMIFYHLVSGQDKVASNRKQDKWSSVGSVANSEYHTRNFTLDDLFSIIVKYSRLFCSPSWKPYTLEFYIGSNDIFLLVFVFGINPHISCKQ